MKFSKEQLMEIEKIFDIYAGENLREFGRILDALARMNVKSDSAIVKKVLDDMASAYDTYRTISAVAHEMWSDDKDTR